MAARRRFVNSGIAEVTSKSGKAMNLSKGKAQTIGKSSYTGRGEVIHMNTVAPMQRVPRVRLIHSSALSASWDIFARFIALGV